MFFEGLNNSNDILKLSKTHNVYSGREIFRCFCFAHPTTGIDKTTTWCYDISGNILSRTEYDYTIGDLTNIAPTATFAYEYESGWKDKLTSFAGQPIVYAKDIIPVLYKNMHLGWSRNGLLTTVSTKNTAIAMQYNASGVRFRKVVLGTGVYSTTDYTYAGNKLVRETKTGTLASTKTYLYNSQGVMGFVQDGKEYIYHKNLFGDVVSIYQGATKVVEYAYDAFGNCTIVSDTDGIGANNPFRYRGYYWDTDLQLYYIQGRYYDPQTGRFVQPANVSGLNPQVIHGLNLYSYSNNQIGVAYSSSSVSGGASCGTFASRVGNSKSIYHGTLSNSSNILSAIGSLSIAFGFFDQWSGYLSGGFDAGLSFLESEGFGFQFLGKYSSALKKFGVGMTIAGNVLSWGSSVYNNFTNPNYTPEEAIGASAMDAVYYTGKALGTYWLGSKVGKLAVTLGVAAGSAVLGTTVFGTTIGFVGALAIGGGVAVLVGIAGAVAIYFLGELLDEGWNWIKEQIFE